MTAKVDSLEWESELSEVILDFYLDHGAPGNFYRGDCVPYKLLEYIDPNLRQGYGDVLLFVNVAEYGMLSPQSRDFILFTTTGIVTCNAASRNFRAWGKISDYFTTQKAKVAAERWPEVADKVAKQISDSLTAKIAGEEDRKTLAGFVRRVIRVMVGVDALPPAQLPYLPLSPSADETPAPRKAAPASPKPTPATETATNAKLQVDY